MGKVPERIEMLAELAEYAFDNINDIDVTSADKVGAFTLQISLPIGGQR